MKYYNLAVDTHTFGMEGSLLVIDDAIRHWCEYRAIDYTNITQ